MSKYATKENTVKCPTLVQHQFVQRFGYEHSLTKIRKPWWDFHLICDVSEICYRIVLYIRLGKVFELVMLKYRKNLVSMIPEQCPECASLNGHFSNLLFPKRTSPEGHFLKTKCRPGISQILIFPKIWNCHFYMPLVFYICRKVL